MSAEVLEASAGGTALPSGWSLRPLNDLADIERLGVRPEDIKAGTLFVGLEHIESGGRLLGVAPVASGEIASTKFRFDERHVLYGKLRPYLAKIALPDFTGVCSTDILPIRPGPDLDRSYLAHFLKQPAMVSYAASRATGANLPRLSPTALGQFPIPLPPLGEQRRIAGILDAADGLRAKRRESIALLDTLTQSIFLDMFGDPFVNPMNWPEKPLGSLALKFSDGPFGSNLKSADYVTDGVRVIRLQNVGVGHFRDEDKAFISEMHFESLRKHECLPGDVLVGTLGDPNLRACVQPDWLHIALNKADCVQIRVNEERALAPWLVSLLNSPGTLARATSRVQGQTRLRVSMGRLRSLLVPVPPLSSQRDFGQATEQLTGLRTSLLSSLAQLDSLFESLQARAFRGEL